MAEVAMRHLLGAESERVEVASAGTAAWDGQPATAAAIDVAANAGVDLSGHRSRRVTPEIARAADLVLVMERAHLAPVRSLGSDPAHSFVLSDWPAPGESHLPISDPFGGSLEAYEECWRRITHHLGRVIPHVKEMLKTRSA